MSDKRQKKQLVLALADGSRVDDMTVHDFLEYLKHYWLAIREQLLSGTYAPEPVKRLEIPKPDGGVRKFGIPKVPMRKPGRTAP